MLRGLGSNSKRLRVRYLSFEDEVLTYLRLCWLWSWSLAATFAVKPDQGIRFNPLRVLAGEVGIAVAGAKFHRMAARESDIIDFAHLCGWSVSALNQKFLSSLFRVLGEAGLIEARTLAQVSMQVLMADKLAASALAYMSQRSW